jgi:hypothetical protein
MNATNPELCPTQTLVLIVSTYEPIYHGWFELAMNHAARSSRGPMPPKEESWRDRAIRDPLL